MIIDHIAWAFLRPYTGNSFYLLVFYEVLRGLGRLTMPIMCLLLVEGFFYTKNLSKYFFRLFVFALISHVPYVFFNFGIWGIKLLPLIKFQTSIIFNLLLSLAFIAVMKTGRFNITAKVFFYFIFLFFSVFCDWGTFPIFAVIIFACLRNKPVLKIIIYALLIPFWFYIHFFIKIFIQLLNKGFLSALLNSHKNLLQQMSGTWEYRLFFLGLYAVIPFLFLYNGSKGGNSKNRILIFISKWFFYIFYPLHLLLLGILKYGNPFN